MLFGKEIEGLCDDGFEGSNHERHIFMDVFFGSNKGDIRKRCFHDGATDFEAENAKPINTLLYSNSGNSIVTSQSSTKDSYVEGLCAVNNDSGLVKETREGLSRGATEIVGCAQEGCTFSERRNDHSANFKRRKWSVDEYTDPGCRSPTDCLLDTGKGLTPLESQEEVPKMPMQDSGHADQTVRCHLVESSSQGIISSCYLIEQCEETERELSNSVGRIRKEVVENKAISLPITQHEIVPKLLSGEASVADMSLAVVCSKESSEESVLLNSDMLTMSCRRESIVDQRPRLRSHVHHLLLSAGWSIQKRKRKNRSYMENVYISPMEKVYHELHKSWRSCGEILFGGNSQLLPEENEKQWDIIDEFWSDLSDTLTYIEQEMQQMVSSSVLAHHWNLLDPFVTVALIDRQLRSLKEGKPVQAVRTVLFDLSKRKDVLAATYAGNQLKALPWKEVGGLTDCLESACEVVDTLVKVDVPSNNSQLFAERALNEASGIGHYARPSSGSAPILWEKRRRRGWKALKDASTSFKDDNNTFVETRIKDVAENQQREIFRGEINNSNGGPAHQSEISCVQRDSCLHDIPVTYGTADMSVEGTKDVIPWQNSNVILASFAKQSSGWKESGTVENAISDGDSGARIENGIQQTYQMDGLHDNFIPVSPIDRTSMPPGIQIWRTPFVVQGVKTVVKETEEACDQKLHTRSFSELCQQSCENDELKGSSVVQHQKLSLSADDETSHGIIKEYEEEVLATNSKLETIKDGSVHLGTHFVRQKSSSLANICSGFDDKIKGDTDSSLNLEEKISSEREMASENLQHSGHLDEVGRYSEVSDIEMEQTSTGLELNLTKKSTNRSKNIQEIKVSSSRSKRKMLELSTSHIGESQNSQDGKSHCRSRKFQRRFLSNDETCSKSFSPGSSQCKIVKQSKFKKFQDQCTGSKELALSGRLGTSSDEPNCVENINEGSSHENNGLVDLHCRKIVKSKKPKFHKNGRKQLPECQIDDDDLLIAALIINKDFNSNSKHSHLKTNKKKKSVRKFKSEKGICRLLPRNPGKGGKHHMDGKCSSSGTRTVLSWLINVGAVSVNDVIQYRCPKNNTVVKDGWITKDGIHCNCCDKVLSVSEFKIHAGFKLYKPCLNLFMESGKSFTLCHLEAWSAEYKARKSGKQAVEVDGVDQNDDTCGYCGDGGELICCDNCPSTFHQACLSAKDVPEGNWFCPNCTCWVCGDVVSDREASSSSSSLKCSQCEHRYHGACFRGSGAMGVLSDMWFCGTNCQEVYSGLRSRVGLSNPIADGFSWIILKCIDGDQKIPSAQRFALMAECNSRLAVSLTIMEECFLPMIDPRTGIDMIPHVLYNWSSNFARLNYEGFYTMALEKGDEIISVASIRVHGASVAEMPLIATRSERRRQGMCRLLMNAIEETLKSYKVERLVVSAIPSLVETWTLGFGFEPMEDQERELLNNVNLMIFPGTILLRKSLDKPKENVTEIKQETNDLPPSCPDGALESGVCGDQNAIEVCVRQSDINCCSFEVDSEAAPALELENLQLGDEQESKPQKNLESLSSKDPVSTLEETKSNTINVECCGPRKEALENIKRCSREVLRDQS